MRYKKLVIIGAALLLIAVSVLSYQASFPIAADQSNLPEQVRAYYNRGYSVELSPQIRLYDQIVLDKTAYVLLTIGEDLGRATLRQSLTGRWRIESLGYGSTDFREGIVESGDKKYLLFASRNRFGLIAELRFTIEGFSYAMAVPTQECFIIYTEIDSRVSEKHLDLEQLWLYDSQGQDITEAVNWRSGSGI